MRAHGVATLVADIQARSEMAASVPALFVGQPVGIIEHVLHTPPQIGCDDRLPLPFHRLAGIGVADDMRDTAVFVLHAFALGLLVRGVAGIHGVAQDRVQRRIGPRLRVGNRLFFLASSAAACVALCNHGVHMARRGRNIRQARLIDPR